MKYFIAALWAEFLKVRRSKILWLTALAFSLVPFAGGLFMIILKDPDLARRLGLIGAKAQLAGIADWPTYLGMLEQAVAVGGLFVFGFVASWVFGREYSDRTIKDLLALPTPRWAIVAAKFVIVIAWSASLTAFIYALGFGIGTSVGLPHWLPEIVTKAAGSFVMTSLLTIAVITPVCFVANLGHGYLSPLGFVILVMVLAQIIAVMGWGEYFPWSIPALYGNVAGPDVVQLSFSSYLIVAITSLAGVGITLIWWYMADQTC